MCACLGQKDRWFWFCTVMFLAFLLICTIHSMWYTHAATHKQVCLNETIHIVKTKHWPQERVVLIRLSQACEPFKWVNYWFRCWLCNVGAHQTCPLNVSVDKWAFEWGMKDERETERGSLFIGLIEIRCMQGKQKFIEIKNRKRIKLWHHRW